MPKYTDKDRRFAQRAKLRAEVGKNNNVALCAIIVHSKASNVVRTASDLLQERIDTRQYSAKELGMIRNALAGHAESLEGAISQDYRIQQIDFMLSKFGTVQHA